MTARKMAAAPDHLECADTLVMEALPLDELVRASGDHLECADVLTLVMEALPLDELVRASGCRACARSWHAAAATAFELRRRSQPVLASLVRLMQSSFCAVEGDDEGEGLMDTSTICFWLGAGPVSRAAMLRDAEALLGREPHGECQIRIRGTYNQGLGIVQLDLCLVRDRGAAGSPGEVSVLTDVHSSFLVDHLEAPDLLVVGALGNLRRSHLGAAGDGRAAGSELGQSVLSALADALPSSDEAPGGDDARALSLPYSLNDWVEAADAREPRWRWHHIRSSPADEEARRALEAGFAQCCRTALASVGTAIRRGWSSQRLGLARSWQVPPYFETRLLPHRNCMATLSTLARALAAPACPADRPATAAAYGPGSGPGGQKRQRRGPAHQTREALLEVAARLDAARVRASPSARGGATIWPVHHIQLVERAFALASAYSAELSP